MTGNIELLFPIILPIVGGTALLFLHKLNKTKAIRVIFLSVLFLSVGLAVFNLFGGTKEYNIGTLAEEFTIKFTLDGIGIFFSALTSLIWLVTGVYATEYFKHEERENMFFGSYLMTYGVIIGIDYSGTLLTLYVFYELMTIVTVLFVIHSRTSDAVATTFKYLFYSLFGAFMGLIAIFFIVYYGGSLDFTAGGFMANVLSDQAVEEHKGVLLVAALLAILGFGTKAGMFPLHGWLPEAHPVAPAPASAVLSGIITKSGVIAIIRVVYYIFGADFIRDTWVQYTWMILALITVVMGSVTALKQDHLKRRLAYSTVSQVSYVLFGLSLLNPTAFVGSMLHVIFHALIKVSLFLLAGAIIYKTGLTSVNSMRGLGKKMPLTFVFFGISSLALVGIPPLNGFISKWYLANGAVESSTGVFTWLGPVALLCSAIYTAFYLFPPVINGFYLSPSDDVEKIDKKININMTMAVPLGIFAVLIVLTGIYSAPLVEFITKIALSVL